MTQKEVVVRFGLLPLKIKKASQVCCLATNLGGLLFQFKSSIFSIRCE